MAKLTITPEQDKIAIKIMMTIPIQRQYTSPNCILSLEGFSDGQGNLADGVPVMSALLSARCQIIGQETSLNGGRVFLEHLIKAVSSYAQSFLSGLSHPWETTEDSDLIFLESLEEKNRHLLVWQESRHRADNQIQWELTTVQLFDLVDAIDQFLNDGSTLPDLNFEIKPLPRRYRQVEETFVEQSTPAALGFVGFALAAIALFFIPVPSQINDPTKQEPKPKENTTETVPLPETIPNQDNPQ